MRDTQVVIASMWGTLVSLWGLILVTKTVLFISTSASMTAIIVVCMLEMHIYYDVYTVYIICKNIVTNKQKVQVSITFNAVQPLCDYIQPWVLAAMCKSEYNKLKNCAISW